MNNLCCERKLSTTAVVARPKHEFHRSCQALLWSHKGLAAKAIATQLEVCQQTVSNWLTAFEEDGLVGLMRQKGQAAASSLH